MYQNQMQVKLGSCNVLRLHVHPLPFELMHSVYIAEREHEMLAAKSFSKADFRVSLPCIVEYSTIMTTTTSTPGNAEMRSNNWRIDLRAHEL